MSGDRSTLIGPGATLGVLGGGQLGRMFALAAAPLGYRVHVLSDYAGSPAGQVASLETVAAFDDAQAVAAFAETVDVVTYEFENVPAESVEAAGARAPVRPGAAFLHMTRHRDREKRALSELGIPVAPFRHVESLTDLREAVTSIGTPCVLKTAEFGYDGKGQAWLADETDDLAAAWTEIGERESVLEGVVRFDREVSIVACRGVDGTFAAYDLVENEHVDGILDLSTCPAPDSERLQGRAEEIAETIARSFDVVGVFCVEFFETEAGLVVNEIAPRPHNSGHLTIEGHFVSQFEQQVRTICGLPPGTTSRRSSVAMANLVGPGYLDAPTAWADVAGRPGVRVHFYGKDGAPPGRKIGHVTALGETAAKARELACEARAYLRADDGTDR